MTAIITAYCACALCCGQPGQPTASGRMPAAGRTIAAPRSIPFGTRIRIDGVGWRIAEDRTARRYDGRIDVFMRTHSDAVKFGKRKAQIEIKN